MRSMKKCIDYGGWNTAAHLDIKTALCGQSGQVASPDQLIENQKEGSM